MYPTRLVGRPSSRAQTSVTTRIRPRRLDGSQFNQTAQFSFRPQHFLYFLPLPQAQGLLRPTRAVSFWMAGQDLLTPDVIPTRQSFLDHTTPLPPAEPHLQWPQPLLGTRHRLSTPSGWASEHVDRPAQGVSAPFQVD